MHSLQLIFTLFSTPSHVPPNSMTRPGHEYRPCGEHAESRSHVSTAFSPNSAERGLVGESSGAAYAPSAGARFFAAKRTVLTAVSRIENGGAWPGRHRYSPRPWMEQNHSLDNSHHYKMARTLFPSSCFSLSPRPARSSPARNAKSAPIALVRPSPRPARVMPY